MGKEPPVFVKLIFLSTVVGLSAIFFQRVWTTEKIIPSQYLKSSRTWELAAKCCALSTVIMFLNILVIMMCRLFTAAGDTVRGTESVFLITSKKILQNTLEENFLFIINLLAAHANGLDNERLVLVTLVYIGARAIFTVGYYLGVFLNIPPLRAPGFALTFINNAILFYFNIKTLIKV
ncbi:unnamed protein product [Blepharisma stoltei]|uniref:Uncharacterized protein n=1 Tax=Blepharisma stoltei TaxID=1481888 RepID=A0AAU9JW80_9CILI|nr:unnamed protein product [Blepharisma stoltei]